MKQNKINSTHLTPEILNSLNKIYENRNLNTNIWEHISKTQRAYEIYTQKEEESTGIQITFSMIFVLFCILFF